LVVAVEVALLPQQKLDLLKRAFVVEGMAPGQAAKKVGIAPATANRAKTTPTETSGIHKEIQQKAKTLRITVFVRNR